ncbi:MAG: cupin domain-containing protein [Thermodesulfovibrionales bacterium]
MEKRELQQELCENHCAYYRPGKDETLACLGYLILESLQDRGSSLSFKKREKPYSPLAADQLQKIICTACPFYDGDCDFVLRVEKAEPCGGFVLLSHLLGEGAVSVDDIRKYGLNSEAMKQYDLSEEAGKKGGEAILGSEQLHTHACYLVYGTLGPGEKGRKVSPGKGHEEIFCLVAGLVEMTRAGQRLRFVPGQAFHLRGEESWSMDNAGETEAVYVLAGGHSEAHEHH